MEKTETYGMRVKSLTESTSFDYLKVVFEVSGYGEHSILTKKIHLKMFCPGTEYEGIFKISGMPDFIGDKEEWGNVCTYSSKLEKILGKNISFETKEGKEIYLEAVGNCAGNYENE